MKISADLVTFTAEILNGKLHFLCSEAFENNLYALGVFIDLSKVFDTVDKKARIIWYNRQQPQLDKKLSFKQETIY